MLKDKTIAKQLKYRDNYTHSSDSDSVIQDIFDSSIYQDLLKKQVIVDGQTQG